MHKALPWSYSCAINFISFYEFSIFWKLKCLVIKINFVNQLCRLKYFLRVIIAILYNTIGFLPIYHEFNIAEVKIIKKIHIYSNVVSIAVISIENSVGYLYPLHVW